MLKYFDARAAARQLAAVGEQTRLMILYTLADGPRNVSELADRMNVSVVNMSHHLTILRKHRLVEDVKDGRFVVYQFHPDTFTPSTGTDDLIGTLSLGICRMDLRRSLAPPPGDGPKNGKKRRP